MNDRELIEAYLDGVGELSADERRRVDVLLHEDPALRAEADASRSTIVQLRALPHEGTEPDWSALEREIRQAVGPTVPTSWFARKWRWLVPAGALAVAATVAALVLHHHPADRIARVTTPDAGLAPPPVATAVWLDGQIVEVGEVDPAFFDDDEGSDPVATGLLPIDDLNWIDDLDETALDRADTWLASKRKKG